MPGDGSCIAKARYRRARARSMAYSATVACQATEAASQRGDEAAAQVSSSRSRRTAMQEPGRGALRRSRRQARAVTHVLSLVEQHARADRASPPLRRNGSGRNGEPAARGAAGRTPDVAASQHSKAEPGARSPFEAAPCLAATNQSRGSRSGSAASPPMPKCCLVATSTRRADGPRGPARPTGSDPPGRQAPARGPRADKGHEIGTARNRPIDDAPMPVYSHVIPTGNRAAAAIPRAPSPGPPITRR